MSAKKKKVNQMLKIAIPLVVILILGIGYTRYIKLHTFTLSGDEEIQSITGTVKVTSPVDTSVIFVDVETGHNYSIPYITSNGSEKIKLEKGKWYSIEDGRGLKVSPVNLRIEDCKQ